MTMFVPTWNMVGRTKLDWNEKSPPKGLSAAARGLRKQRFLGYLMAPTTSEPTLSEFAFLYLCT